MKRIIIRGSLCYSRPDIDRKYPELTDSDLEPEITQGGGFVHWLVAQGHGGLRWYTNDGLCGLRPRSSIATWRGVDVVLQCKAQLPDKWDAYMALVAMGLEGEQGR